MLAPNNAGFRRLSQDKPVCALRQAPNTRMPGPVAGKPRQPVLRGAVWHLQISRRLASQRLCHKRRSTGLGEILFQLVYRRAPSQQNPLIPHDLRHVGQDGDTLANRAVVDVNARAQKPERWSGKPRDWQPTIPVWRNPERETSAPEIRDAT